MSTGTFITLEGIEGVGKTTHMNFVQELLQQAGHKTIQTREPGGTKVGEAIRDLVLNSKDLDISAETELLMIFSARAQHINEVITPALNQGYIVLCDRFTDATYAYQGGGRSIPMNKIGALEDWVQGELRPDLTLLLDAPVETGLARASKRSEADRIESETVTFFEKVRETYLNIATEQPERISIVDASLPIVEVQSSLKAILKQKQLC